MVGPCPSVSPLAKEAIAEGFGTFILMVFGQGSVAQYVLSDGTTGSTDQIRWAWGLAVAFGVFVAGGVSGGHINPAVTLSLCVTRKCRWKKLLPYWAGQFSGAFLASGLIYFVYYVNKALEYSPDAIHQFNKDNHGGKFTIKTAGIFATYPNDYLSVWNGLLDQVVATAVLLFLVNALTDPHNKMAPSRGYLPLVIGLIVTAIGMSLGHNCGYAINPARDLSPRLFTLVAGWGMQVFSYKGYTYFWIPVAGPFIGGVMGSLVYVVFFRADASQRASSGSVSTNASENNNVESQRSSGSGTRPTPTIHIDDTTVM